MWKKLPIIVLFSGLTGVALGAGNFKALDTDKNGSLSRTEASLIPNLYEKWNQADANSDGAVDEAEFSKFEAKPSDSKNSEESSSEPSNSAAKPADSEEESE